jgi:formylglycine-generating enzyme required for sulfatase activity
MVHVPAGTFQMGSTPVEIGEALALCQQGYPTCNRWYYEREGPQHPVSLDGFWIDQTEISNAQYRLCVEAGICAQPSTCQKGKPSFADLAKADHPVVCVNWEAAQTYCQWVGARLPNEAEWEFTFRGEAGSLYPWGDEFDGSRLNYCDVNCIQSHADDRFDDGYPQTAPVGSYPQGASWAGVLDLGGNVSEWVADWLGDYSPAALLNPLGPSAGNEKILKGCSWFFHPAYCRGAARPSVDPDTSFDYLGFRCANSVDRETGKGAEMVINPIMVPPGKPPAIDGSLSPGEWDQATTETFADGSELLLLQAGGYLYLGIRANMPGMIAGNVFVKHGDQIDILHASAALGTAIYQKGEDSWQQVQDFSWRCRNTGNSESAQSERVEFLQDEGWLAANGRMGTPNELEYQIKIQDQDFRLAVVFTRSTYPYEKVPWPANLDDDCIKPTPGGFPATLAFSPDEWGILTLTNPGE